MNNNQQSTVNKQ